MEPKPIAWSKTFWINVATCIVSLVDLFTDTFPEDAHVAKYALFAAGVINIIVRTFTVQPVKLPGQPGEPKS